MADTNEERVLIVFDGDNFSYLKRSLSIDLDYIKLIKLFSGNNKLVGCVYFTSFENPVSDKFRRFKYHMRTIGIQIIPVERRTKYDFETSTEYKAGYEDGMV